MIGISADRQILVVDDDSKFIDRLIDESNSQKLKLHIAKSGSEAQAALANKEFRFAGVFVNPEVQRPSGISVVRASFFHRPQTPVYFILDSHTVLPLDEKELEKIGVQHCYNKPMSFKEMVKVVAPIALTFQAKDIDMSVDEEVERGDEGYVGIRSEDFLSGNKSLFDVYIKIKSKKYIKLLFKGDTFEPERLEAYLNKGVQYFYIKKEVHEIYLGYCDHLATALLNRKDIAVEIRASQVLNAGEETIKFLKSTGMNDDNIQYAAKFVNNVRELTKQLKVESTDAFQSFLNNVQAYEHGVGTAMLASILASKLEIQMERPVQIVGMAAMFHDIALSFMSQELWDEDETKMTKAQKELFYLHPAKSAEMMRAIKGIDPATIQAIEQHHMRQAHKGFPDSTNISHRSKVGELIGLCDEYNKLIKQKQINVAIDIKNELEKNILPNFSRQISYAFRSAFFPSQNN